MRLIETSSKEVIVVPRVVTIIVVLMAMMAVVTTVTAAPASGAVILYPDGDFSPPNAAVATRVDLGLCTPYVSPRNASSSVNGSRLRVLLYASSDCSGEPAGTLDAQGRLAAHPPVNSVQGIAVG